MFHESKKSLSLILAALIASTLVALPIANADEATVSNNYRENHYNPSDSGHTGPAIPIVGMPVKNTASVQAAANGVINYHVGAPVMVNPNIYVIWYGTWTNPCSATTDSTTPAIVNDLIRGIGSTSWYGINTSYYSQSTSNGAKTYVTPTVTLAGCFYDNASLGKNLDGADSSTSAVVDRALTLKNLPLDTNGLYFVFTSSDIVTSGFVNSATPQFCGYHSYMNPTSNRTKNIIYSFVGDPGTALASCNGQSAAGVSPNSNPRGDAMTSVIAHELVEAVSDPFLNAWFDAAGNENADKCAWTFGTTSPINGAKYNMVASNRKYLIQQNWVPIGAGNCAMAIAPLAATTSVASKKAMLTKSVASFTPVTSTGGFGSNIYTVTPPLPSGLSINANSGAITGTPTVSIVARLETVTVTDAKGGSVSATFTLQVSPALTATRAVTTKSITRNLAVTPFTPVTGGGSVYTLYVYSISPALPGTMKIDSSTGAITGTPPNAAAAARNYTVTVTDDGGFTATGAFALTIL
jgi:Phosphate-induced protein 1 conserved region/Putative Ig domain